MHQPPLMQLVPEEPAAPEVDHQAVLAKARRLVAETVCALDDVIGLDALDGLDGAEMLALHSQAGDLSATLATLTSVLADRLNQWIWAHGKRSGPGGAVAEIAGQSFQATMVGGPGKSLKVPEQVALGHAIFERAVTETIRGIGLDPDDDADPEVLSLKTFGSCLDAMIVGRGSLPAAARLSPMRKVLAGGLVDPETGEILRPPEGQIRWALDVSNYETPTSGVRRRSFSKVAAPPTEDDKPDA